MSRQTARNVLDQLNARPAFIAARYAANTPFRVEVTSGLGLMGDLRELAEADAEGLQAQEQRRRRELAAAYGLDWGGDTQEEKPFLFAGGKAIIPIHGMLINRFPYSWGFVTGYNYIKEMVAAASADPDVNGIVYDVNTYGGLVAGCDETSRVIYQASAKGGGKPSLAMVDANCYSAGYYLASGADHVSVVPSGGAGSIGVVLMHADISGALDEMGVKVTFIHAGDHKVDGNAFQPLSKEVAADLQREINKMYDKFVGAVVRNRPGLSDEAVRETQARCYQAEDALNEGLIDSVQTPPDALESFFNGSFSPDLTDAEARKDQSMPPTIPADTAADQSAAARAAAEQAAASARAAEQAAATARTAERDRIKAILSLPEAEGRTELANHLALGTDMTAEASKGILAAAPKAAAPAAAAATAAEQDKPNYFRRAMNNSANPNVGADTMQEGSANRDGAEADSDETKARNRGKEIVALQERVQGKPPQRGGRAA